MLPERFAAGAGVGRIGHLAAHFEGVGLHPRVGQQPADAEGNQRARMGMHDRPDVRPAAVNLAVKRKLRRRRVQAAARAVRLHVDDVARLQAALVHARRGDPDAAIRVEDRQVAAGGGRHPVAVDALHGAHEFFARVEPARIHAAIRSRIARACQNPFAIFRVFPRCLRATRLARPPAPCPISCSRSKPPSATRRSARSSARSSTRRSPGATCSPCCPPAAASRCASSCPPCTAPA
jgi:hypothetical protein